MRHVYLEVSIVTSRFRTLVFFRDGLETAELVVSWCWICNLVLAEVGSSVD
jgi:hypothetical protein